MANSLLKYLKKELQNKGSIIITPKIGKELVNFLEYLDPIESINNQTESTTVYKKIVTLSQSDIINGVRKTIFDETDITNKNIPLTSNTTIIIHSIHAYHHYESPIYTISDPNDTLLIVDTNSNASYTFELAILTDASNVLYRATLGKESMSNGIDLSVDWNVASGQPTGGKGTLDLIVYYSIINHG